MYRVVEKGLGINLQVIFFFSNMPYNLRTRVRNVLLDQLDEGPGKDFVPHFYNYLHNKALANAILFWYA